jgi:hypothetical protein
VRKPALLAKANLSSVRRIDMLVAASWLSSTTKMRKLRWCWSFSSSCAVHSLG